MLLGANQEIPLVVNHPLQESNATQYNYEKTELIKNEIFGAADSSTNDGYKKKTQYMNTVITKDMSKQGTILKKKHYINGEVI